MLGGKTSEIIFGKLSKNLGIRAKRIQIGTLGGCKLYGCCCCCKVYDGICYTEGFGLLFAKGWDRIAALTPGKRKHSLKLSAYISRTAVYA